MTENFHMSDKQKTKPHRVVFIKGEHQWRFEWQDGEELGTVQVITEIAQSSETNFDWFDAAMVCHEMSKMSTKAA